MKFRLIIGKEHPEEVCVYAQKESRLTQAIRQLCEEDALRLVGYRDKEAVRIHLHEVCCFAVEDNKVYAHTLGGKYLLKCRLYTLEEELPESFVKINQSCIANLERIQRFDASFAGTLNVYFQNGYFDYVSRRNLKTVKERMAKFYE